jgi:hypothetical protein
MLYYTIVTGHLNDKNLTQQTKQCGVNNFVIRWWKQHSPHRPVSIPGQCCILLSASIAMAKATVPLSSFFNTTNI